MAKPSGGPLGKDSTLVIYRPPPPSDYPSKRLVDEVGIGASFLFHERVEIGRYHEGHNRVGVLQVKDPTVSSRHCVITQDPDGTCFVRDVSRNGTRIDGRRLSPNSKTELKVGQVLSVGRKLRLRLDGDETVSSDLDEATGSQTLGLASTTVVTVLVGDIRNFTTIVRKAPPAVLQESVARVFAALEKAVVMHGGTLKEFQGDALFAFWEQGSSRNHASEACRAALDLHRLSQELARDASVWAVEGFPLEMDWALTTGLVAISGYGGENVLGLSMVGESVVLAFRLEKLADETTGPIVTCPDTRIMAGASFEFEDLGSRTAAGFDSPQRIYALVGEKASGG
jgi:adenylate cyclase